MYVLAVDPAARGFAWALLGPGGLVACGEAASVRDLPPMPRQVEVFMERPQDYVAFGVAHDDLDRLRRTLRAIATWAAKAGYAVVYTTPHAWKGNVPKVVHHNRLRGVLGGGDVGVALPGEPGYNHNVADAVGLALFRAGRVGRGGTTLARQRSS